MAGVYDEARELAEGQPGWAPLQAPPPHEVGSARMRLQVRPNKQLSHTKEHCAEFRWALPAATPTAEAAPGAANAGTVLTQALC